MKIKKLNSSGFSHGIVLLLFVVIFAIAGIGYIVASHAATNPGPIVYTTPKYLSAGGAPQDQAIMTLNPSTGEKKTLVAAKPGVYYSKPVYSPNNKYVAWLSSDNMVGIYDFTTSTTKSIGVLGEASGNFNAYNNTDSQIDNEFLAWNGNGTKLALSIAHNYQTYNEIYSINVDGSGLTKIHTVPYAGPIQSMAMTEDGSRVVYAEKFGGVYSVASLGEARVLLREGQCKYVQAKHGSPTTVSYVCNDINRPGMTVKDTIYEQELGGTPKELYVAPGDNNNQYQILGFAWSYDASKIAAGISKDSGVMRADCSTEGYRTLSITTFKATDPSSANTVTSGTPSKGVCQDFNPLRSTLLSWGGDNSTIVYQGDLNRKDITPNSSLYKAKDSSGSTPTNLLPLGSLKEFAWNGGADLPIPTTTATTPPTPKPNDTTPPKVSVKFESYRVNGVLKGVKVTAKGQDNSGISTITIHDASSGRSKTCKAVTICERTLNTPYNPNAGSNGNAVDVTVKDKAKPANTSTSTKVYTMTKTGFSVR